MLSIYLLDSAISTNRIISFLWSSLVHSVFVSPFGYPFPPHDGDRAAGGGAVIAGGVKSYWTYFPSR